MKPNDQLEPTVFVIFGGAGDLTWRKLVPALFDLSQDRSLPADFSVIAVDRVDLSDETLRRRLQDGVKKFSRQRTMKPGAWGEFARHLHYQQGDFKTLYTYTALGAHCAKLEKQWGAKAHRIFYMATPPSLFGDIQKYLGKAGLARDREWARIVVEKPIGYARMKVIISKPPACAVWQDTDVRYPDPMIMGYLLSNEGEFTTTRSGHTAALGVSHLPPKPSSLRADG